MLALWGEKHRFCDGLSRRDFLRVGALGLGGLTLADVLRLGRARGSAARRRGPSSWSASRAGRATSTCTT